MNVILGRICGPVAGLLATVLFLACPAVAGWTHEYSLALPANQLVSYRIELDVSHAGPLVIKADWSPHRVLAFRLVKPGAYAALRKSGSSPLTMKIDVTDSEAAADQKWTLWIRGLPARKAGTGRLIIALPEPPSNHVQPPAAMDEPEPDRHEAESWKVPLVSSRSLSRPWTSVYDSTERFRRLVVDESRRNPYGWHDEFLRYLERHRQRSRSSSSDLTAPTTKMLKRMASAVDRVEQVRASDDPILAGPPPADPSLRRAWIRLREARLLPLEGELDTLLRDLQNGYAPQIQNEIWVTRWLSCLIVCEKHFDDVGRVGNPYPDDDEVFSEQWRAMLAAAQILKNLAALP